MSKKATRISILAKGKNIISELLSIKENRINRGVEAALDAAKVNSIKAEEDANLILNRFGDAAEKTDGSVTTVINDYLDKMDDVEYWEKRFKQLTKLKELLKEEVEVEEENENDSKKKSK